MSQLFQPPLLRTPLLRASLLRRILLVSAAALALAAAYAAGVLFPVALAPPAASEVQPAVPVDFAATIETLDFAAAVDVITGVRVHGMEGAAGDAERFEAMVDTLHQLVLGYIAARLGLSPQEHAYVLAEYARDHRSAALDYAPFLAVRTPERVAAPASPIVTYQSYDAVNEFVGVLSGHVCGLLRYPGRAALRRAHGLVGRERTEDALGADLSCNDVLAGALAPVAYALRREAVVQDLNTSHLTVTAHVRSMVAELATAEERISADFSDAYTTRVLFVTSTATVRAEAHGTVKAGFDLSRGFGVEVDHERQHLVVRLPAPEILSNEVEVQFTDVDNGMFVSIDAPKYNAALTRAREMIRERAVRSGVFAAAKRNAEQIVLSIFQPVMAMPQFGYDVYVAFPGDPSPAGAPALHEARG